LRAAAFAAHHDHRRKRESGSGQMKRVLDSIAYSVTGLVLAAALLYGWRQLTAPPPMPAVPPLAEAAPAPPPPAPAAAAQPAATPPPPAAAQAPAAAPAVEASAQDAYAQDRARFDELQKGCYEAAANNRNGEYPSLQAMACDRYAQFAASRGWQPVTLPAYGQAPAAVAAAPEEPAPAEPPPIQDQSQVILLAPGYYGGYGSGFHRLRPPPPATDSNSRPQQQIGPNFAPPPPQQPPPVPQRQGGKALRPGTQDRP
jgi:hypothetical protein